MVFSENPLGAVVDLWKWSKTNIVTHILSPLISSICQNFMLRSRIINYVYVNHKHWKFIIKIYVSNLLVVFAVLIEIPPSHPNRVVENGLFSENQQIGKSEKGRLLICEKCSKTNIVTHISTPCYLPEFHVMFQDYYVYVSYVNYLYVNYENLL